MTKDRQSVVVGAFAVYSISDVVQAIHASASWDVDDTVSNITLGAVVEVVTSHTLEELMAGISQRRRSTINRRLTTTCKRALRQFGVNIHRCGITDFSTAKVYRLVGNEQVTG